MAPMKRPAAAGSASSPAKKAAKDPLASKCAEIAEMFDVAQAVPQHVRAMLKAAMPHSVLVPKDQRHSMQEECVSMIEETLAGVQADLQAKVDALQAKLADGGSEKETREKAASAAAEVYFTKVQAMEAAKGALGEAVASTGKARSAHKDALSEQQIGEDGHAAAERKKTTLEASKGGFESLMSEGGDKQAVKAVIKVAKEYGFEQQLIVAAESALVKKPEQRGGFDKIVFLQFEEQFSNFIAAFAGEMANWDASKGEHAAKVDAAVAEIAAADEAEAACRAALASAQAALGEAEAARSAADQALRELGPEMRSAAAALQEAQNELKGGEAVVATFKALANRVAVVEVPVEPVDTETTQSVAVAAPAEAAEAVAEAVEVEAGAVEEVAPEEVVDVAE